MSGLLEGMTVVIDGDARPLHVAGRCLADLGADVASRGNPADEADRAWLGGLAPVTGDRCDLVLRERGAGAAVVQAATTVWYSPVSAHAQRAGEDLDERELAAAAGIAVAVGDRDAPPLPLAPGSLDAMCGFHVAAAGVAALLRGVGETEVAGADVAAWMVATNLQLYLPYGLPWLRDGRRASGSGSCYPWALFEASDGPYCLIGRTDRDWQTLLDMMGRPAWADDPLFADPRVVGRRYPQAADEHVAPWVARHTRTQLDEQTLAHGFPGAPVLQPAEVLELPALENQWRESPPGTAAARVPGASFVTREAPGAPSEGRPLAGLVVLDLAWVWSGPAVSVALGDLGATVIKVESAKRPDNSRLRGAPVTHPGLPAASALEVAPYFHALNRGKLSVALDLKSERGLSALRALADEADVIVENLSAGVMDRWGIAPDDLHETNPGCVFLSMRGFRDHETTRGRKAYAPVMSSGAGLEAGIAYPGQAPVGAMSIAFSDALATSHGVLLALSGIYARRTRGRGAAIMLSQFEVSVFANGRNLVACQLPGAAPTTVPFAETDPMVTAGAELRTSPWISQDLIGSVEAPWIGAVEVARLPWRAHGRLPALGDAGPVLGGDSDRVLGGWGSGRRLDLDRLRRIRQVRE